MNSADYYPHLCPVCGGVGFRPWKLGLQQCTSCLAIFSPMIWQKEANELLEEEWFYQNMEKSRSFWVEKFESWNNNRTLKRIAQAKPRGRRVLEVGVGSGAFLGAAKAKGFKVVGCDLSPTICNRAREAHGIIMHCGPLDSLNPESRFDVVVMNHVLEHVQAPVEFLKTVFHFLAPGGVLHIAVPNVSCWEASFRGWTSFEPYHLSYFSPQTLRGTVVNSGFVIEQLITHDSFSGWFLALLRTAIGVNRKDGAVTRPKESLRARAKNSGSILIEHAYRVAMVVLGGGGWPLRVLQARLGYGDEIICIAQKPKN